MTLNDLALEAKTDKGSSGHNYTPIYETYIQNHRFKLFNMLELGVGGYSDPDQGGESLRMWAKYFHYARVVGVDFYPKTWKGEKRIFIEQGSQDDPEFLNRVNQKHGPFSLIVDDASHVNPLTIKSFEILFPLLMPGGLYIVEDVQTSFWPKELGDPDPFSDKETTLKYFQRLTFQLYSGELLNEYQNQFFGVIEFIHFYEKLVIVKKK